MQEKGITEKHDLWWTLGCVHQSVYCQCSWANHFNSLCLSFYSCKMRIIILTTLLGHYEDSLINTSEAFRVVAHSRCLWLLAVSLQSRDNSSCLVALLELLQNSGGCKVSVNWKAPQKWSGYCFRACLPYSFNKCHFPTTVLWLCNDT